MLGFLFAEAVRDLRRTGRVGVTAVLLIAMSLAALGAFWILSINMGRAVAQWRERLRVVAYLKAEPSPAALEDLTRRVQELGGVQRIRYVSKREALASIRASLGAQAAVVEQQLPQNPLPASLEITPVPAIATPEGTRALAQQVAALPEVDDVQGGAEWVESLAHFQRLFQLSGLTVGAVLALAAILTVTTATTLVMHLRREETDIMRLVGATETAIRMPALFQGLLQGLAGAVLALGGLEIAFFVLAPKLEPLLGVTLGLTRAVFLAGPEMVALLGSGAALGALGGVLAKGRVHA
jgi:cell division transport system permease protein